MTDRVTVRHRQAGLLTTDLSPVATRLVRLGVAITLVGVTVVGVLGLVLSDDVRSPPLFAAVLLGDC